MRHLQLTETANVLAYVAYFGGEHLGEILRRKRVHRAQWTASDDHWRTKMMDAVRTKELDVVKTFNATFAETKNRLEQEETRLEDIGPLPEEVDHTAAEMPAVGEAPPDEATSTPSPPEPPEVHAPIVPPAAPVGTSPPATTSPWARTAPSPPRPVPPLAEPTPPDVTADAVAAVSVPLPFDAAGPNDAPRPAAAAVEAEANQLAGGTSFVPAVSDAQLEPSTPFAPEMPPGDIDGTAFIMAPFEEDPLPFEGENPAPPPAAADISHSAAGATSFVPAVSVTPSAPMSPEAYARLVYATYQKPPPVQKQVHHAHGLDGARRAQLDAAMAGYMRRHPEAFRVYMQWVQHLRRGGA